MSSQEEKHSSKAGTCRQLTFLILVSAAILTAGPSMAASACSTAVPLPGDHSLYGHNPTGVSSIYAFEVGEPGFLIAEVYGISASSRGIRILDSSCRRLESHLPLSRIRGRHVQLVEEPGIYYVKVPASRRTGGSFRIDAWFVPFVGLPLDLGSDPVKDDGDEPPREPMDEWDEIRSGGYSDSLWLELPGYGVLEFASGTTFEAYLHSLCPWRPGLESTYTCGRHLRIEGTAAVH